MAPAVAPLSSDRPSTLPAAPATTALELLGRRRRTWPLVPPAPLFVLALAVLLALVVGAIGVRQLARQAEASAASRAELMAETLSARLAVIPAESRHDLVERASRRGGVSVWLVDASDGVVEEESTTSLPVVLPTGISRGPSSGEIITTKGSLRYATRPIELSTSPGHKASRRLWVVAGVDVVGTPEGTGRLVSALLTLTALFAGVAFAAGWAVARDVRVDVDELGRRILEIAQRGRESTDRAQDMVPVQSLDEVGELAAAFNALVERFASAEKTYADALARVEEIDRERSTFLATVSHELRSPLNAILGFADVLLSEVDGPLSGEAREEVAVIKQSGLHLLGLINDILELSALASAQVQLVRAPTDLVPIAAEVVREARGARGDKPVELRVTSTHPQCVAHVDARRIRQVLTNLVGNALKFTPRGEVLVSLETDAHYATIRVRDTGPGIPDDERESIFDEYRQGGDRRARRRGTGLGLAIARRLALMHGGAIRLESEVGVGSTFVLKLPVRAPVGTPRAVAPPRPADDSGAFAGAAT